MWHQFHFLRPWWFLAIVPIALLLWFCIKKRHANYIWQKECDPHLLTYLLANSLSSKGSWFSWLLGLTWLTMMIALAGPTWSKTVVPTYQKLTARVIALDVSRSMDASDLSPSRLVRAKYKILDLLKAIKEGQTGMVVFSSEPFAVTPLTSDTNTIANLMPDVSTSVVPVQGSNLAKAMTYSAKLIKQAGSTKGEIILVTDSKPSSRSQSVARSLAKQGFTISVLAVGTLKGGPVKDKDGNYVTDSQGNVVFATLPQTNLRNLAENGDGIYVSLSNTGTDIQALLNEGGDKTLRKTHMKKQYVFWHDEGIWFVWISLFLGVWLARKGWLESL